MKAFTELAEQTQIVKNRIATGVGMAQLLEMDSSAVTFIAQWLIQTYPCDTDEGAWTDVWLWHRTNG